MVGDNTISSENRALRCKRKCAQNNTVLPLQETAVRSRENIKSSLNSIFSGVPQRSILGPMFFLYL